MIQTTIDIPFYFNGQKGYVLRKFADCIS
jgi:hypothetical protein